MDIKGLSVYEAGALKETRTLLIRKPDAVMQYLSGQVGDDNKGLLALSLSAQVNHSKMQLESMKLCLAVTEHIKKLNYKAGARELLQRAADKLNDYCTETNGDMNDSLATEIETYLKENDDGKRQEGYADAQPTVVETPARMEAGVLEIGTSGAQEGNQEGELTWTSSSP